MTFLMVRYTLLAAFSFLLASCQLFHPRHREGAATSTQTGDVTVDFVGVTGFTEADLRDALFDPLDSIKHDGLNNATADDAAFFLELFYRKNGYSFVSSNYTIIDGKHLQLKVDEGPLVLLGDIRFIGNDHFKDPANFQQYIIGQTRERFPASRKDLPYVDTDVQKGTDLVQRFYLSQGYLEARIGQPTVEYVSNRTRANLTIPIVEGHDYHFGRVELQGPLVFPEKEVRGLIADQIPLPYTRPRVDAMQRKLEDFYKKHGYFTATVTANSDPTTTGPDYRVPTTYVIKPGPLYHFDGVRIVGTDRLKPEFLRNRFRSLSGKVYDPKALDDIYQLMVRTGLFAQLKVEPVPQPDDTLRLDIGVKESKSREFGFSLGYGTFEGPIIGFDIRDRDFNGTGRPISFEFDYSARTVSGELLYVDSHLFETDNELRLRADVLTRDLTNYAKQEISALADLNRSLTKQLKVSVFAQAKSVKITDHAVQNFQLGLSEYTVDSIGATASLDLRDNPVSPTRGLIVGATGDMASKSFGGDLNYVRATGRATYFLPVTKKTLFVVGLRVGVIQPFGATAGSVYQNTDNDPKTPGVKVGQILPIDERFFLGGSTTVRSFPERTLGPYDPRSKQPIGGDAYTIFNAEYQFPLLPSVADLKGAVFFDAGNLRTRAQDLGFSDERYGIGLGIRYNLPIGPLRLDYGVNPNPRRNENNGAFNFSFGFAF